MIKLFKSCMPVEPILERLRPVLASGWYGRGKVVEEFEEAIAPWTKQKYFVATSSCTAALHLALHVLGIGKGDIVATTPITFVSTNAAILYVEATPVFLDTTPWGHVDCAELTRVGQYLPIRIAMIVHLGGMPSPSPTGFMVVEDCAHAFGSRLPPTDNLRCWSFGPVKNLPIGSGGGVSTNDAVLAAELRRLRWMGIDRDTRMRQEAGHEWEYGVPTLGWNYAMTDVQAAMGLAMLPYVAKQNERRRQIAQRYHQAFSLDQLDFSSSSCHFYPVFIQDRQLVVAALRAAQIECGVHYKPNHLYPAFRCYPRVGPLQHAEWYGEHEITLPMHPGLTDEDVERIITVVQEHEHSLRE